MNVPPLSESEATTITPAVSEGKWCFVVAGLLALFYFVTSILIARHRLFWYDEILTVGFSRLPNVAEIWKALAHGVDGMTPTYYLVVRLFEHLPVAREVSARLPSALAMAVGMLITFDCARRLTDDVHGLLGMAVLSCSGLSYYGYEARSYALLFMFASMALWLWLNTDTSRISALLFGVAIFLGVAVHYYTVLCLVPFAVWELWNWRTRRALVSKLAAGVAAVLCSGALFWAQALSLHRYSAGYWSPPTLVSLLAVYDDFFPYALFALTAVMVLAAFAGEKKGEYVVAPMKQSEQLCWFFALIPLSGFVLAKLATNAFVGRYFIDLLPGIAVGFSCLLWRQFRSLRWVSVAALLLFAALGLGIRFRLLRNPAHVRPLVSKSETDRMKEMLRLEEKVELSGGPIVIREGDLLSLEAHYYSKRPERYVFLLAPHASPPYAQASATASGDSPIRYWAVDELMAHARESTLIDPSQETLDALEQAGYKVTGHIVGDLEVVKVE